MVSWEDFWAADGDGETAAAERVVVWRCGFAGDDVVGSVRTATHAALDVLQRWLAGSNPGTLVVLTRGAMALPGEDGQRPGRRGGVGFGAFCAGRTSGPDRADRR